MQRTICSSYKFRWIGGIARTLAFILVAGTLGACSSSGDGFGSEEPEATSPPASVGLTLQTVEVGRGRLDFIGTLEGVDPPFLAVESSPGLDEVDPVAALFAQYGPLTMLEVFRAVAAPGLEPHPVLVQSHPSEAAALQRADGSVKELRFDSIPVAPELDPLIEKALPPDFVARCRAQLFAPEPSRIWTRVLVLQASSFTTGDNTYLCTGGESGFWLDSATNVCTRQSFTQVARVGMCHLDPQSPPLVVQFWGLKGAGKLNLIKEAVLRTTDTPKSFTAAASTVPQRLAVVRRSPVDLAHDVMGSGVAEPP